MNYHSHDRRDEVWTVISGSERVVIDGEERLVSAGDVIDLPIGCKHTVFASESGLLGMSSTFSCLIRLPRAVYCRCDCCYCRVACWDYCEGKESWVK